MNWERVMFQAECDPEGTGWCQIRDCDPAECSCYGPTQEGLEYQVIEDVLYARPNLSGRMRTALEKILPYAGRVVVDKSQRDELNAAVKFALSTLEEVNAKDSVPDLG